MAGATFVSVRQAIMAWASPQAEWIARADQTNLTRAKGTSVQRMVRSAVEEEIMVLVLIDTVTGTRRTILVPVKMGPQRSAAATILTHAHFAARA